LAAIGSPLIGMGGAVAGMGGLLTSKGREKVRQELTGAALERLRGILIGQGENNEPGVDTHA